MTSLGASVAMPYDATLSLTMMLPLRQETLYDDSDAFKFGPLVSLTELYAF